MKLLPLYDLQQEINRLFIAGSKFAKNDPRLQKQIAIFNKLGEKAPVFKKIADGVDALVKADTIDSSAKLLEISTLLYAVLYTQGETTDTEQTEIDLIPLLPIEEITTEKSYKALKPLIEVLTEQKQGRLEIMKDAFENNQLNDFRTYHLLDAALADRYSDLADYIETVVIPSIGNPMLPFLINSFSYEGRVEDVRRFRLLYKFGYSKIEDMINEIFEGKSVPLQAEAVRTLGRNPDNEELLIKFADDKQKPIRLSAYEALGNLKSETAQQKLVDLFVSGKKKSDTEELSTALKINLLPQFVPVLLDKAKISFNECIALDKSTDIKVLNKHLDNLCTNMNPLLNNADESILNFYEEVFLSKKFKEIIKYGESKSSYVYASEKMARNVAQNLAKMGALKSLKLLAENSSYTAFLYSYFKASVNSGMDKAEIYNTFVKYIDKLLIYNAFRNVFIDEKNKVNIESIDARWANIFEKELPKQKEPSIYNVNIYITLVGVDSEKARTFIFNMIALTKQCNYFFGKLAEYLIESKHPKAIESIFEIITNSSKNSHFYVYHADFLKKFPVEYVEKFRKLGETVSKSKNMYYSNAYYSAADIIEEANFNTNSK